MTSFKAKCTDSSGYVYKLTEGKVYDILEEQEGIFKKNPYYIFIDDNGKKAASHKHRFEKIEELHNEPT